MSHFAKVCDGKVLRVIVAEKEFFDTYVDDAPGEWIQTSYNTQGGKHLLGGTPLRGNYAGIGYTYDLINQVPLMKLGLMNVLHSLGQGGQHLLTTVRQILQRVYKALKRGN
jgi:hypothetical protein